ncbi:hypothetical protein AC99_3816 [Escherichia coli 2-222-05_S4_C2]|nr:hypothetical protein AC99_3816 [Escherichia coli 2-222-05_S4_C2]KEO08317.1 hypothetical protein AD29_4944 [Escherichia coli 2-222-05_S4_C3]
MTIIVKSDIKIRPGDINSVYSGVQCSGIPAGPSPIAQQAVVPAHVFCGFQGMC